MKSVGREAGREVWNIEVDGKENGREAHLPGFLKHPAV